VKKIFILIIVFLFSFNIVVFASGDGSDITNVLGDERADVTIEEVEGYVEEKGNRFISFLQYAAEPVLIIAFILSALIASFGAIGDGNLITKGLMGMIISGVSYSAILFAPELLSAISSFLRP
jgi:hypothetical protein